jgi:hypothetical protein
MVLPAVPIKAVKKAQDPEKAKRVNITGGFLLQRSTVF